MPLQAADFKSVADPIKQAFFASVCRKCATLKRTCITLSVGRCILVPIGQYRIDCRQVGFVQWFGIVIDVFASYAKRIS